MLRKKLGLFMTVIMVASAMTGCGDGKANTVNSEKPNNKVEGSSAEKSSDGETFRVATVRWADWGEDYRKGFVEETEKAVGINIQWETILNADWGDKKAVLMAGGDLPDAFWGSICFNDAEIAQNLSAFIPLEDLIEENMPNLMAAFNEEPALRALVTSPDGHIYSLPKKLPSRPIISNQPFINQVWLDNLGLEMPDTYEDFYNVLKAFKEQDANGNGNPNDEIPYGAGNADSVMFYLLPFGMTMGADNTYTMAIKDGKPVHLPTTEDYRAGIEWMHKAYKEGLIDQEIFTQDTSMSEAKRQDPAAALVGVSSGWTADAVFGTNGSQYVALNPLKGPDGERYVASDPQHYNYGRNELLITTKCKNPAALLKWADAFYTEDASIQTFYGSFGVGVEKAGDGTYSILSPPEGESADLFAWVNSFRDFGPKYISEGFNAKVKLPADSGDGLKLELDKKINQYAKEAYPNVYYTSEQLNRLSTLYIDLGSYIGSIQSKWVVDGGASEEWESYLSTLKQMGYDEFMQIQIDAYNTYKAAMN